MPVGPGLALVPIVLAPPRLVVLAGILAGYDGLASIHGEGDDVALLTPEGNLPTLLEVLGEVAHELALQIGVPVLYGPAP